MELGLSRDEEVRHLDHMMTQEEWRGLTGSLDEFGYLDHTLSQVATSMLRHGACYRAFPIDAMGYVPLAEIYEIILSSRANRDRMRIHGPTSEVDPRALISFFQDGQGTILHHWRAKGGATHFGHHG
jgi:hypothetical protein